MNSFSGQLDNITNKELLQINLSATALYIGMYEHFIDMIVDRVESFLNSHYEINQRGELKSIHGEEYKRAIKDRRVDENGNKNILKASMLWFVDIGAITHTDYTTFLDLKTKRDSYVHDMTSHILDGLSDDDAKSLTGLMHLYAKIDRWWINEIEIPTSVKYSPDGYDKNGVQSVAFYCFRMMFETLFDLSKKDSNNTD